jgi:hypothetical protein
MGAEGARKDAPTFWWWVWIGVRRRKEVGLGKEKRIHGKFHRRRGLQSSVRREE